MGLLTKGTPLTWDETVPYIDYIKVGSTENRTLHEWLHSEARHHSIHQYVSSTESPSWRPAQMGRWNRIHHCQIRPRKQESPSVLQSRGVAESAAGSWGGEEDWMSSFNKKEDGNRLFRWMRWSERLIASCGDLNSPHTWSKAHLEYPMEDCLPASTLSSRTWSWEGRRFRNSSRRYDLVKEKIPCHFVQQFDK